MANANMTVVIDEQMVREIIDQYVTSIEVKFTASGVKSSEGDGRTAADIEKELKERNGS